MHDGGLTGKQRAPGPSPDCYGYIMCPQQDVSFVYVNTADKKCGLIKMKGGLSRKIDALRKTFRFLCSNSISSKLLAVASDCLNDCKRVPWNEKSH